LALESFPVFLASSLIDTTAAETPAACKNCDSPLLANWRYCADCGQKAAIPRLTMHEIGHETLHALLHVDRSVVSLIRALALRPGRVALDYVSGRRKRYYGPFAFLVICVAIASATIALTGFAAVTSDVPNAVADFLQHHVNLLFFAQVPILAAACRLLTPRGPFNYAEFLVLVAYSEAMHILFFTVIDVGGWYLLKPSAFVARVAYLEMACGRQGSGRMADHLCLHGGRRHRCEQHVRAVSPALRNRALPFRMGEPNCVAATVWVFNGICRDAKPIRFPPRPKGCHYEPWQRAPCRIGRRVVS
jgi:hypothetical protein